MSLWHEVHGMSLYREGNRSEDDEGILLSHTDSQWALMKAQTIPQGDGNELFCICAKSASIP